MNPQPVLNVLSRLPSPKPAGSNKWLCKCPAHNDKSPSLTIKEGECGTVLLHCFAGCSTKEVVESIGLTMADLFVKDSKFDKSKYKNYVEQKKDAEQKEIDLIVVKIAEGMISRGESLTDKDRKQYIAAKWRMKNV